MKEKAGKWEIMISNKSTLEWFYFLFMLQRRHVRFLFFMYVCDCGTLFLCTSSL